MKLFVYGTLRRGERAHALLGAARFLGQAWTEPRFRLVDMGGYPALVEGGSLRVLGEIYEIDPAQMDALDAYEDCPRLYRHAQLTLDGHEVTTYVLVAEHARGMPELSDGDWCAATRP